MQKATLKQTILQHLTDLAYPDRPDEPLSIIFHMPYGLVSGKLGPLTTNYDSTADYCRGVDEEYRSAYGLAEDDPLDGKDGYILLYDASVHNGGNVLPVGTVALFFDQICGMTFGSFKKKD